MDEDLDLAIALSLQEEDTAITDIKYAKDTSKITQHDEDLDYAIAVSLQGEQDDIICHTEQKTKKPLQRERLDPSAIVDPYWELVDPHPNIHSLFCDFDIMFFNGVLSNAGVAVSWSKRMKLCAGLCRYEGRGGLCSIQLSEPLMMYRPRKDLVETLLHEMIHGYLFVTANNKDREGHGPEFVKHMQSINRQTGASITVYHNYHAEVNLYRQHWWKCTGPCQHRPPFFGTVRRSTNRAPSKNDHWWAEHQRTCGGTFEKVKEPEGYKSRAKKSAKDSSKQGDFSKKDNCSDGIVTVWSGRGNGSSPTPSSSSGSLKNVKPFSGKGRELTSNKVTVVEDHSDKQSMRDILLAAAEKRREVNELKSGTTKKQLNSGTASGGLNSGTARGGLNSRTTRGGQLTDGKKNFPSKRTRENTRSSELQKRAKLDNDSDCEIVIPKTGDECEADDVIHIVDLANSSDVIDLNDDTSQPTASQKSTPKHGSCPICGRTDIPQTVLGIHVGYCLDEMECFSDNEQDD